MLRRNSHVHIGSLGEVVSPPQTILLKLLDSYLQSADGLAAVISTTVPNTDAALSSVLAARFFALAAYAQRAVQAALGDAAGSGSLDLQLPTVCAALVLVAQSLVTILLAESELARATFSTSSVPKSDKGASPIVPDVTRPAAPNMGTRALLSACRSPEGGTGFVESVLGAFVRRA